MEWVRWTAGTLDMDSCRSDQYTCQVNLMKTYYLFIFLKFNKLLTVHEYISQWCWPSVRWYDDSGGLKIHSRVSLHLKQNGKQNTWSHLTQDYQSFVSVSDSSLSFSVVVVQPPIGIWSSLCIYFEHVFILFVAIVCVVVLFWLSVSKLSTSLVDLECCCILSSEWNYFVHILDLWTVFR